MSRFYKLYNSTDNCWKRILYQVSKTSVMLESYDTGEIKYKTPIGLISIQNYHSPNCGRMDGDMYNE